MINTVREMLFAQNVATDALQACGRLVREWALVNEVSRALVSSWMIVDGNLKITVMIESGVQIIVVPLEWIELSDSDLRVAVRQMLKDSWKTTKRVIKT